MERLPVDLSLRELRNFEEVARLGNISRAAQQLGLTQPALSWSIKKIEESLGVELFHRSRQGVVLTKAGSTFLARSRQLNQAWRALTESLIEDEDRIGGEFTLGVHATIAGFTLPRFCPPLLTQHPNIQFKLIHDLSRRISEGVISFEIDYGIVVNPPKHPDLTIAELFEDEIRLWSHQNPSPLQLRDQSQSIVICHPDMVQTETMLQLAYEKGLLKGKRIMYTPQLELIAAMVAAGGGLGLLPASVARSHPSGALVPVPDSPTHRDVISLIWRGEAQRSPTARIIRETIIHELRKQTQDFKPLPR